MSVVEPLLAAAVDDNEIAAMRDWLGSLAPEVAEHFGVQVRAFGNALAIAVPGTGTVFYNRVIGLGGVQPASRALIRDVADFYRDIGTRFMIHAGPHPEPPQMTGWLREEGLTAADRWLTLYRRDEPVPEPVSMLRLERIGTRHAGGFAQTLCRGYGMPEEWAPLYEGIVGRDGWRHFMAFDGDIPVATSSIFITSRKAWCGNSGTLRRYRRHGLHTALSRLRLRDAIDAGCTLTTGETWLPEQGRVNQSQRNHERDGWRPVYIRTNYVSASGPEEPDDDR
jgi:GNAT superfamily N-acetyltransferase